MHFHIPGNKKKQSSYYKRGYEVVEERIEKRLAGESCDSDPHANSFKIPASDKAKKKRSERRAGKETTGSDDYLPGFQPEKRSNSVRGSTIPKHNVLDGQTRKVKPTSFRGKCAMVANHIQIYKNPSILAADIAAKNMLSTQKFQLVVYTAQVGNDRHTRKVYNEWEGTQPSFLKAFV